MVNHSNRPISRRPDYTGINTASDTRQVSWDLDSMGNRLDYELDANSDADELDQIRKHNEANEIYSVSEQEPDAIGVVGAHFRLFL